MCNRLIAFIIATTLLTISFFILVVMQKIKKKNLKSFGYVLVALLWLLTIAVLIRNFYMMMH